MVQGRVSISAQQLNDCFDWNAEAFPPFPPRSNAILLFRAFVREGLTPSQVWGRVRVGVRVEGEG